MTTAVAAPPPAKRRWKLRALIGVSLLLAAGMIAAIRWAGSVEREMAAIAAELDASDPGWRLAEIEAARKPVADADNAALKIMAIVKRMNGPILSMDWEKGYPKPFPPQVQLSPTQIVALDSDIARFGTACVDARVLANMPTGRFPIQFGETFHALESHVRDSANLVHVIKLDVTRLAQQGKPEEALVSCQAMLNCARAIGDENFLISRLVRAGCQSNTVQALERVLAQGEVADALLKAMQQALVDEASATLAVNFMRTERAMWFAQAESVLVSRTMIEKVVHRQSLKGMDAFLYDWAPTRLLRQYPGQLRAYTEFVEAGKLPSHERQAKIATILTAIKSSNPSAHGGFQIVMQPEIECMGCQARLHCTIAALACERFRLTHQRWPATLDAMVQAKLLATAPTDPLDNTPLRLVLASDGLQVHSSGPEQFRLWNVPARRQPPLPVPPANAKVKN
jgi:hypothetical protein